MISQTNINQITEINITERGLKLDDKLFTFPIPLPDLIEILGPPCVYEGKQNNVYTWHTQGVYGYSKDKVNIDTFAVDIIPSVDLDFVPTNLYTGEININGQPYQSLKLKKKKSKDLSIKLENGACSIYMPLDKEKYKYIAGFEIRQNKVGESALNTDTYAFKPVTGKKIEFTDLNFKLCIIQNLMYEQKILTPVFDVYEFVKGYDKREIDIEEEGYEIIPEVKEYFEKLEISKEFADKITEIYQDGGDDIYLQLNPLGDGEEDWFDMRSVKDAYQFKNLKKATIMTSDESLLEELKAMGIEAEML